MEQETFWTLLHNAPHWEFELFLMFIFDFLIGLILWPMVAKFFVHHKSDDDKIAALETEVAEIKKALLSFQGGEPHMSK
jgi:hypothetical protein